MAFRTNYKEIHERAYQNLRAKERSAWSDPDDANYRIERFTSILARGGDHEGGTVLVLGSGDGEVSIGLTRNGFRVVGIDISPTAVAWAREKAASQNLDIEFIEANVLELNPLAQTFAAAIDDHCFHCIIGPDRRIFLEGVRSHLEDKGLLLIRTQCGDPPSTESSEFLQMWDQATRCQVYNGVAGRYFGLPQAIASEVEAAGFEIVSTEVYPTKGGWQMMELLARKA